ncbi:hypothetical protein [Micromonospora sp. WMMA1976]|uniref:hypothetical protein n=1 Tax=Micromonospora sp. WMMA1976 TaxID=3014995 RepID=UPI00248B476E|nr:hypothetical protein [Micromonospora sp. WMMA1976]WBC02663.1 hypothetical protein O7546_26690 [Micromonospora sp. WMMA1976]
MTVDDRGIPNLQLSEDGKELLANTLMELRSEALSLAASRAVEEGASEISSSDLRAALMELGVISAAALDRKEAARGRYRIVAVVVTALATAVSALIVNLLTGGWDGDMPLDRADQIAASISFMVATASALVAGFASFRAKQATNEAEKISHVVQDRVRAANFLTLWGELETQIRAAVAESSGYAKRDIPIGVLFKHYAQLAGLSDSERNSLTSVLNLRNRVAHGRVDYTSAANDIRKGSVTIAHHIERARDLATR